MFNSYLNIITFIFTTIFYFFELKPKLTYDILSDNNKYLSYKSSNYKFLGIYILLVIIIQFIVNSYVISSTCGGNITENMIFASIYTFIPWTLIFGVMIVVIMMYPGFKTAFSNVIGYFWVAHSANKIINELLVNKNVQTDIDKADASPTEKQAMMDAADAIIKICGNTSILINEITPLNFISYWDILKPLMKEKYKSDTSENETLKNELLKIVVSKDDVGLAMWYIYTGVLLTAIVQLKISTKGCTSSTSTLSQNYQEFLNEESTTQAASDNTVYTITN
jgi:hypothetical protein